MNETGDNNIIPFYRPEDLDVKRHPSNVIGIPSVDASPTISQEQPGQSNESTYYKVGLSDEFKRGLITATASFVIGYCLGRHLTKS